MRCRQSLWQSRMSLYRFTCFLILIAISASDLVAQIHWTEVTNKPVMEYAGPGEWDAAVILQPSVIKDADTLKMWYSGRDSITTYGTMHFGYAWSLDGIEWTRYHNNPVFSASLPWEGKDIACCAVLKDEDTLRMWYINGASDRIGYATSTDGIHWDKYPEPVLHLGPQGDWDSHFIVPQTVIKTDSIFRMWYWAGPEKRSYSTHHIGLAISRDGITWKKYDNPLTEGSPFSASDPVLKAADYPAWDQIRAYAPAVLATEDGYEMFYAGRGEREFYAQLVGHATSQDGISWTKNPKNPVIDKQPAWGEGITNGTVLHFDGRYHLWFSGFELAGRATVGYMVSPPWWHTTWAYILFAISGGLALLGLISGTWRMAAARARVRTELRMKRFEAEKLKEIDELKSRFFANISHEFRTPLTLILGPLERMVAKVKDSGVNQDLKTAQQNAHRLLRLINQLLDLSKMETGSMRLEVCQVEMGALIKQYVETFQSLADSKGITLKFESIEEGILAFVDRDKLQKIVFNLVSNALKFTPEGGRVMVSLATEPEHVVIGVSDTGMGIPPDQLEKVFNRFYQVDGTHTREQEGTGIGLALTKELVELHHGEITVSSEPGRGSRFIVRLPLGKDHLSEDEIVEHPIAAETVESALSTVEADQGIIPEPAAEKEVIPAPDKDTPMVLIVEDNAEMRRYIRGDLEKTYRIVEAGDGNEGLEQAQEKVPDLIISDVMMPGLDGNQLCEKLKTDERTSHIPVILLTAKAGMEDKVEGLETGADDYITKPFDVRELRVRIRNLIEQRRLLREKFGQKTILHPRDITVTSIDERFLQRALDVVEMHMSDEGFNVEGFSKAVGMSRANLHRKLRALTNHSASEFIRTLRLTRAAQLLKQNFGSVSEVAFEAGFSNPTYFSECFRKQFGIPPSKYASSRTS